VNVLRGGIDLSATVVSAIVSVFAGGTDIGAAVGTGGALLINSGGTAISATLTGLEDGVSFGLETVLSGGRASNTVVSSGGLLLISAGGLAVSTIVDSIGIGGTASGGMNVFGGGLASALLLMRAVAVQFAPKRPQPPQDCAVIAP
jgi:autotransporter passenger strand-loop-strand repeat protein